MSKDKDHLLAEGVNIMDCFLKTMSQRRTPGQLVPGLGDFWQMGKIVLDVSH